MEVGVKTLSQTPYSCRIKTRRACHTNKLRLLNPPLIAASGALRAACSRGIAKIAAAFPTNSNPWHKSMQSNPFPLGNRMAEANDAQFAAHPEGAWPEDAAAAEAPLTAAPFINMPDGPSTAPLPEGGCGNNPDLDAPLTPSPKKARPRGTIKRLRRQA